MYEIVLFHRSNLAEPPTGPPPPNDDQPDWCTCTVSEQKCCSQHTKCCQSMNWVSIIKSTLSLHVVKCLHLIPPMDIYFAYPVRINTRAGTVQDFSVRFGFRFLDFGSVNFGSVHSAEIMQVKGCFVLKQCWFERHLASTYRTDPKEIIRQSLY